MPRPSACRWTPRTRIRHARGQSLPDWIALRSGRLPAVPDAVARPGDAADVRAILERARAAGWRCIPYGGGSSVVGGVSTRPTERPVVALDLTAMAGLRDLDERSGLATFGAGTYGPALEAALAEHDLELGHVPQSFEYSTVGGWVADALVRRGVDGRRAHRGAVRRRPPRGAGRRPGPAARSRPRPPGPDLRELVLGSEGRLGVLTDVTVRPRPRPERDIVRAYRVPSWDDALSRSGGRWPAPACHCASSACPPRSRPRRC